MLLALSQLVQGVNSFVEKTELNWKLIGRYFLKAELSTVLWRPLLAILLKVMNHINKKIESFLRHHDVN